MKHSPPLSELGAFFEKLISLDQIEAMGWASGGAAAATVANAFAVPYTRKIPLLDKLPAAVHRGILGVVEGRLAYESPMGGEQMACGILGATVGREVGVWVAGMLGLSEGLGDVAQLPGEEELAQIPYADSMGQALPSDQVAPASDALRVSRGQLAEVVPIEFGGSGLAALAAQAVDVQELSGVGSWIGG